MKKMKCRKYSYLTLILFEAVNDTECSKLVRVTLSVTYTFILKQGILDLVLGVVLLRLILSYISLPICKEDCYIFSQVQGPML